MIETKARIGSVILWVYPGSPGYKGVVVRICGIYGKPFYMVKFLHRPDVSLPVWDPAIEVLDY